VLSLVALAGAHQPAEPTNIENEIAYQTNHRTMNHLRKIAFLVLFIFIGIANIHSQVNLPLGLVANYPFSGTPNDVSGNNHHGVLVNGPTLTSDRFGAANSAYHFDGVDDYIRITDPGAFPRHR
jgi:hypothetical protein